ncbi:hypothetical protein A3860_17020 [Niastella vici]|uniref:Uncharacterized protein n=1 Tax=Niastella vici TaxID=1703345 RepID=A0A1V9G3Z7_9BACT|nr:hypothetical protein A3860_17020 [Niastella vici]
MHFAWIVFVSYQANLTWHFLLIIHSVFKVNASNQLTANAPAKQQGLCSKCLNPIYGIEESFGGYGSIGISFQA